MTGSHKRYGSLLLLWVIAVAPCFGARPRLVVLLVVDQLRTDYLERFRDHYEEGLHWLLEHGATFPDSAFRHSATVTSVGHATISTGLHPSTHGIVGNSWWEAARGWVYSVEDESFPPVGGPGSGRSPRSLLADTLGDRLKARYPGSKVYSISTKDRSAILLAGKQADGAFWFEPDCGCLVTSGYYRDALPEWVAAFNEAGPAAAYSGSAWTRIVQDEAFYERLSRRDGFPTEADGTATSFPHPLPERGFEDMLAETPFSDEITFEAALAALRSGELGKDDAPDLLALALSATDSIGHRYGPFSQEAMDNHLRLDRGLGRLLDGLDRIVGLEHVVIALSADHGALPLVEHLQEQGIDARRFSTLGLWAGARKAVDDCGVGVSGEAVARASGTSLYWNEETLREHGADAIEVSECVAVWMRKQPGVEAVMTAAQLAERGGEPLETLFENAYYPGRSAHIQLHLREYYHVGRNTGTGHGTAHPHDRRVPLLFAGSGIVAGVYEGPAGPEDIAPTLGAVLGVGMPLERDTRALKEILVEEPR